MCVCVVGEDSNGGSRPCVGDPANGPAGNGDADDGTAIGRQPPGSGALLKMPGSGALLNTPGCGNGEPKFVPMGNEGNGDDGIGKNCG